MGILVALLSGALMSIQGVLNTAVTKQTSVWVAAGWVQLTAFFSCILLWMVSGRQPVGGLLQVAKAVYEGALAGTEAAKALRKG